MLEDFRIDTMFEPFRSLHARFIFPIDADKTQFIIGKQLILYHHMMLMLLMSVEVEGFGAHIPPGNVATSWMVTYSFEKRLSEPLHAVNCKCVNTNS